MLIVTIVQRSSDDNTIYFRFVDDVMFSHNTA